jgi:hypothetical protein
VQLIAWNSQGAKWDTFWTNWLAPALAPQATDVVGLLVEAGWAPWIQSDTVSENALYWLDSTSTRYDAAAAATSVFCQGAQAERNRWALWVPWVANLDAFRTNTRCSMGGAILGYYSGSAYITSFTFAWMRRPVIRVQLVYGRNVWLTVLLVHLVSGYWQSAQAELTALTGAMTQLIPQSTTGLVVGDMNIDLLTNPGLVSGPQWRLLRTGVATQQSGGELDYALLYDPARQYGSSTAAVLQQYKTGPNQSDHSVLRYTIA